MRHRSILAYFGMLLTIQSCQNTLIDKANKWTHDVKQKIIEDASHRPTKTIYDTSRGEITTYNGDTKLKYYYFKPGTDKSGNRTFNDTAVSIFYSTDQNFQLVRELCPANDGSFEGLKYKNNFVGLAEFKYCNGIIKKTGFRYYDDIGIWTEFDTAGIISMQVDKGNSDRLKELENIKYYR